MIYSGLSCQNGGHSFGKPRRVVAEHQRIAHAEIRFFFPHVLERGWGTFVYLDEQKEFRLPKVLKPQGGAPVISCVYTLHNRAYLSMPVVCLQEALHLESSARQRPMMHHIPTARCSRTLLSATVRALPVLRDYWKTHRHPEN